MTPLGPPALPLALLYGMGARLFRWSYESGRRRRHRFPVPVVSVGNIEVGGTGKSPLVTALCRLALSLGRRPAVVSRGYGRLHPDRNLFVSRGEGEILLPVEHSGDEPALLARTIPGVPVVVAARREEGIRMVLPFCDLVILDDGFQSLEICPALCLVILPDFFRTRGFRLTDLLPAGPLRENPRVLTRATHWILSGPPDRAEESRIIAHLSLPDTRPVLRQQFRLESLLDFDGREGAPIDGLSGLPVALVVGVGKPERVESQLKALGADLRGTLVLPDHAPFTPATRGKIDAFAREMRGRGASLILTTQKDRIKWTELPTVALPVLILAGRTELVDPDRWRPLLTTLFKDNDHGPDLRPSLDDRPAD